MLRDAWDGVQRLFPQERILVVDRDSQCRAARLADAIHRDATVEVAAHGWRLARADGTAEDTVADPAYRELPIQCVHSSWEPFFSAWFAAAIAAPESAGKDAVVPSPLMPHLLADWIVARIAQHRPGAIITRVPLTGRPDTPWKRTADDHTHYASFATWMCPINCIEPERCPETRGPRNWTMPASVRLAASHAAEHGTPYDVTAVFQTSHRAYGVGMFDVSAALDADLAIGTAAATGKPGRALVASVSHCHGALAELVWRDP